MADMEEKSSGTAAKSAGPIVSVTHPDDPELSPSEAEEAPKIPWSYKWIALACVVLFPVGQTWTGSSLGPLKNTLRNELGINNTEFGVISSADSFVNTVFPILGGLFLDWWGPNIISLCCTSVILVGSIIAAVGVNVGMWRLLVGGHVLMGFGIAVMDSAQQKFFYHWFGPSGFAFAFGLENAFSSTVSLVAGMVAIPIRDGTGWYGWTFWVPAALCGFSFIASIIYACFDRFVVPDKYRLRSGRDKADPADELAHRRVFSLKTLYQLPWVYLLLPATQLLQSGAAGGFSTSSADVIFMKGYTEAVAGYLSTAQKILPILLSPAVGFMVDRYGHRFHLVALAPILWIIACSLLGFTDVHPVVALVFSSLAGVINAMPLQICIPLLVADQSKLGTAFGLWRAFNNSGSTIMDVVFGVLQDGTEGGGYSKVLTVAIAIKAWAFVLGVSYIIIDYRFIGKGMTMTLKKRTEREDAILDRDRDPLTKREIKSWFNWMTFGLLIAMIASSWALFIHYLI